MTGEAQRIPEIEHTLEDGWTLPASWYSDERVFALERERIFSGAWTYAGPLEWVVDRGCYFATQIGHVPVAVVRGADDTLRGFVNVCRHRGHLVLSGEGCRETLQCPYHAWTYDLDGTLHKAPRSEREPGFDSAGFSLLSVSVGTWGPFVFVNPDPDAAPLEAALGEMPEIVARSGLDVGALRFHSHHEWPIDSNWKIALENYLECYHCPAAHPGFSKVIDVNPDSYLLGVHPTFSSQIGPVRASALEGNGKAAYTPRGVVEQSQYHFLFPATTVNIAPGITNISVERWVPDGAKRTVETTDYYFGPEASISEIEELMAWDNQVGQEDVSLVESVQRGLDSGTVPQGRLMEESEQLIADFQRRVRDALLRTEARISTIGERLPPATGLAAAILDRLESPAKLPLDLARWDETDALEHAHGCDIVSVTDRDDYPHLGLVECPLGESKGCFGRIPATAPIRNYAVPDLQSPIDARRPLEADIADDHSRLALDDHPYAEGLIGGVHLSLHGQDVQKVGLRPFDG